MRSGALAARPTDKELDKGRVEKTTVRRYRAGQAPAWAEQQAAAPRADAARADALAEQVQRTAIAAPVVVRRGDDPRLARLAQRQVRGPEIVRRRQRTPESGGGEGSGSGSGEEEEEDEAGAGGRPQRRRPSPAASEEGSDEEGAAARGGGGEAEEEEDEEAAQRRREAIRERLRAQQQQREQEQAGQAEESEEEEEESEYETDSEEEEDEGPGGRRLVKPVFVPRGERETLDERVALDQEEEEAAAAEKLRAQQRKIESRQLVVAAIAAEEAALRAAAAGGSGPAGDAADVVTDDEGDGDADAAFEEWKGVGDADASFEEWMAREMTRIARDREEKETAEKAARERERLKNMTEEERLAWERANPKDVKARDKSKWKFMQKYWHKGAFFQEAPDDTRGTAGGEAIFSRDYSAPTGEDVFDKASLPAVMQVRNFGRTGRTKWTHLLAEDTSVARKEDEWGGGGGTKWTHLLAEDTSVARKEDEWYQPGLQPNARTGAVSGGFARTAGAAPPPGGAWKRPGGAAEEFSKPKKFKT
ncbi:MAG: splicing factor, Prp19-binding domain-containing protein [Monoraphidium minutum]|nr:MAG: splicing factor, Prp19-binding domain-containing protein [Monoraphidium minutum]